ncbi:MAG: ribokinase [Ilumatobacteraceae bacterium]|nr:ribokinase [Ilumatobacteraceae bacterium]
MFDVVVVGSANLDLVATVDRLPGAGETVPGHSYAEYPGGKGLNQAVAAARGGAVTAFVGAVGDDVAGAGLLDVMRADGIDTTAVAVVGAPTGRAMIGVGANAENSIIVIAGANDAVTGDRLPACRVVLSQLEVPVAAIRSAFTAARSMGATTVLNPAPAKPLPDDVLALCDVLTPNEHEVELLGGVDRLLSLGARAVVVTLGARGAALHTAGGDVAIAPFAVTPVDTTGAGDTFSGTLCARLALGEELTTALRAASAAGALCTTRAGAVPSIPYRIEVDALLAGG